MSNLIKALILALLQLPMFGGAYVLLKQLNQDPVLVAAMAVAYEVVLFVVAFGKKVWATLEPDAVQAVADWIKAVAADVRRRFDSSARNYARWVLSEQSRVTAFGYDLDLKTKPSVRRIFVNLRLDGAAPSEISRAPFFARPALDGDRIWTFLRQAHGSDSSRAALVVLGKAGFGKTTLMQHIGLTFASNRQFRYGMLPHTPLLLYLREHYKTILDKTSPAAAGEPYTLGQLAQEHYALRGVQLSPGWFEQQLDGGKCVVLLDGLDEVPRIEDRQKVSAWIDAQISAYRQSVFVVTSRPEGHEEAPLQNPKCRFLAMLPFTPAQRKEFLEKWYLADLVADSAFFLSRRRAVKQANEKARQALAELRASPTLSDFAVNPLLLTMIAIACRTEGTLAKTPWQLYREIYEVLLHQRAQKKGIDEPLTREQKHRVLLALAADMMERQQIELEEEQIKQAIKCRVRQLKIDQDVLRYLESATGLIARVGADRWMFTHKTFMEYLVACRWSAERADPDWSALIGDSWWFNALRFYAAMEFATPIAEACFAKNTVPALALAADCLDAAPSSEAVDEPARRRLNELLTAGLESDDPQRRRLAAEVQLTRRLNHLRRVDEQRAVDTSPITCAEYQLFIDDARGQGDYRQPDHWTACHYLPGQARQPIAGVRAEDAQAFCAWLTRRYGHGSYYRLLTQAEAGDFIPPGEGVAVWSTGSDQPFCLVGASPDCQQEIACELSEMDHPLQLPSPPAIDLAAVRARVFARALARALDLDRTLDRGLDRALAGTPALNIDLDRDFARVLDLDLARALDLALDLGRARARALDLAFGLALDLACVCALDRPSARDLALDGALDIVLDVALDLDLDVDLNIDLGRTLDRARARSRALDLALTLDRTRTRTRELDHTLSKAHAHALARSMDVDRNRDFEIDHARDRELALALALARGLAIPPHPAPAGSAGDLKRAEAFLGQMPNDGADGRMRRRAQLLGDLLEWCNAGPEKAQHARHRYAAHLLECAWIDGDGDGDGEGDAAEIDAASQRKDDGGVGGRQAAWRVYWWLRMVMAREEGKLPAWEGIWIAKTTPA